MNKITFLLSLLIFSIGCKEQNDEVVATQNTEQKVVVEFSKDTVKLNENARAYAELIKSNFPNQTTEIIVAVDYPHPDKKKAEQNITVPAIFHNLGYDTINRKYFRNYDLKKTVAFGKKMTEKGVNKITGSVIEFYGFDIADVVDKNYDSLYPNKINRTDFEKEIYVIE